MIFQEQDMRVAIFFKQSTWMSLIRPALFVGVVDLITVLFWWIDWAHYPAVEHYFLPIGFTITAIALYATRYGSGKKDAEWRLRDACMLGMVQGCSLLPGISRFASTYSAGRLLCGYNALTAFALSFLIQFPLICVGFLKGLIALHKTADLFAKVFAFQSLFVMLIASLVSYWLLDIVGRLVEKNKLYYVSWYMIIPISISLFFEIVCSALFYDFFYWCCFCFVKIVSS